MREIFRNIKNMFKYGKKEIAQTWAFFFVLSLISKTPHTIFILLLLSGLYTLIIVILASIMKYLKLLK
jgi:hypothetical protein